MAYSNVDLYSLVGLSKETNTQHYFKKNLILQSKVAEPNFWLPMKNAFEAHRCQINWNLGKRFFENLLQFLKNYLRFFVCYLKHKQSLL